MFQLGKKPLEEGMNILGAHIDSPRIDVKQNPLYEDSDMAYLDTHYYGGIKEISVGYDSACDPWNDCKKTEQCGTLLLGKRKMIRTCDFRSSDPSVTAAD